jgi:hypothetical protein
MKIIVFSLRLIQVSSNTFLILVAIWLVWKVTTMPSQMLTYEQLQSWIAAGSNAETRNYVLEYQGAVEGLRAALTLFAKIVGSVSFLSLFSMTLEYMIRSKSKYKMQTTSHNADR